MPPLPPPRDCPGNAYVETYSTDTGWFRVHSQRRNPAGFNPLQVTGRGDSAAGRFDSDTAHVAGRPYGYLYVTSDRNGPDGAFAEVLLRRLRVTDPGPRPIPRRAVEGLSLSRLSPRRELRLVVLHSGWVHQIGQDNWLTDCDPTGYPLTREWAAAVRRWAPDVDGMIWRSRWDDSHYAAVVWADLGRAGSSPAPLFETRSTAPLTEPTVFADLSDTLKRYRAYIT